MPTLEDIDALLAADKLVAGRASWDKSRETTVRINVPLSIGDEIVGGLFLKGTASVHNSPQDGSLILVYQNNVIERMSVFPTAPHPNPFKNVPGHLRGITLQPLRHRYYAWMLNRRFPRPERDNLPVAEAVDIFLQTFDEAITYFLQRVRIAGDVPAPPHEPRLGL